MACGGVHGVKEAEMATVGDVVYLKSGGPPLTVIKTEGDPGDQKVTCSWMNGGIYSHQFPENSLVIEDPLPALAVAREKKMQELRAVEANQQAQAPK
jgi:uncharacterized protein YodC (DUF2158 family)